MGIKLHLSNSLEQWREPRINGLIMKISLNRFRVNNSRRLFDFLIIAFGVIVSVVRSIRFGFDACEILDCFLFADSINLNGSWLNKSSLFIRDKLTVLFYISSDDSRHKTSPKHIITLDKSTSNKIYNNNIH